MMAGAVKGSSRLRQRAEGHAGRLPALIADAEHLAAAVVLGDHGRRRAGTGDEFWQYRPAEHGDGLRDIDWRRSARSDAHFVRQKEWQTAQSVLLWVDQARSMAFTGSPEHPEKGHRSRVLALALCILLNRGGERFGLLDMTRKAQRGELQLERIAAHLAQSRQDADFGTPDARLVPVGARMVFLSDFLGDLASAKAAISVAADRGVRGCLVQVLDPDEENFPYDGRTIFETMSGAVKFETLKAGALRGAYLSRLQARKSELRDIARKTGWQYLCHHTDGVATPALMWLYRALEQRN